MRPGGLRVVAALLVAVGAGYLTVALLAPLAAEALALAHGVPPSALLGGGGRGLALVCASAALASGSGLVVLHRVRRVEEGLRGRPTPPPAPPAARP